MLSLVKGGAFDQFCNRYEAMIQYIWLTCDKKKRITLQNLPGLIRYDLIPHEEKYELPKRIFEFNRYLKAECKVSMFPTAYKLDERAISFLIEIEKENLIQSDSDNLFWTLDMKQWDKVYQNYMDIFREWIADNKEEILDSLNTTIFMEDWEKYASGNISSWEMESLCFYYHDHELSHVNNNKYGFVNYFDLQEEPVVDKVLKRGTSLIPIYKLYKLCGTCIAKNKTKSTVYLLTTAGVVPVKFRQEHFALFDKQTFKRNADGTRKVIEKSWFNRGNMIIVQGIRRNDEFVTKKYASSDGHQLYHIDAVLKNGDLVVRSERRQGDEEYDDE